VEVHERQQRRAAAGGVGDQRAADAAVGEGVVVQPEAEDPLAGRAPRALGGDRVADAVQRVDVEQADAARVEGAEGRRRL
jgi:hypothetical protein